MSPRQLWRSMLLPALLALFTAPAPSHAYPAAPVPPVQPRQQPDPEPQDVIARYRTTGKGTWHNHPDATLIVESIGGRSITVNIPNTDESKYTPTPSQEVISAVKGLKAGDLVRLTVVSTPQGITLRSIDRYEMKPGENTPGGFVFKSSAEKTAGKSTNTYVVLTKFGQEQTFAVATHKGDKGEAVPDAEVTSEVSKLKEGDPVWAETQGRTLVAIEPYSEPKIGKFVKAGETEVNGHKLPSAEIDQEGKSVTVVVPAKQSGRTSTPDAKLAGAIKKLKPGTEVAFRVHEEGSKQWLREIMPAPKTVVRPERMRENDTESGKKKAS